MTNLTPEIMTLHDLRVRVSDKTLVSPRRQRTELERLGFVGFDFDGQPLPFPLKKRSTWCAEVFELLPYHATQGGCVGSSGNSPKQDYIERSVNGSQGGSSDET